MRSTLDEYAGGDAAFLRLARAHHERCLADPELNHPFSHPGQHPHHVERLAAYWAEVPGGPPSYSRSCGEQSALLELHAGNGDMSDLGHRFTECFLTAADDAGLPGDPAFRPALRAYMEWAVEHFIGYPDRDASVPAGLPMPPLGVGRARAELMGTTSQHSASALPAVWMARNAAEAGITAAR
jgi:hemoglobin